MRIAAVVQVVSVLIIVIVDIEIVRGIPIVGPVFRPRIEQQERESTVLETRIPHIHTGECVETEEMPAAEREHEGALRNVVAAVAPALRPTAMVGGPVLGAVLLEGSVPLPTATLL